MDEVVERVLIARPLTAEAFGRYGEVVEHRGDTRRVRVSGAFETTETGREPALWVSRTGEAATWPVRIQELERHPRSAQTFLPLDGAPYLVVVAPDAPDGGPDPARMEAFVASAHQGVLYRRNVWHHGLSVFRAGAQFAVIQVLAGEDDDEFRRLPASVRVEPAR